ncbi:heavy-metal-associated domain-containing protein [Sanguibacter sp. 25GB23B1]|uniref:heavy-metal-associated domain-containing protein n=1 Tax=unclassified Sanguibacter TaxID=2645534 RepID=UPI0032AEB101
MTTSSDTTTAATAIAASSTPVSTHTVLRAESFSCPSCVAKIEKQVGRVEGVTGVTVHFASSRIEIDHDAARVSVDQLVSAVAKAGYAATSSAF